MALENVRTTGFTADTAKNFIVDAGALYKNLEFDKETMKYKGEPLGATAGGSSVKIEQEYRTIEVDGVEYPVYKMEISRTSHPFYTGKSKLIDTAGRIDKFKSKYAKFNK